MRRILLLCLLLSSLTATAQAEWERKPPFALDDPLARRIVCTGSHEVHMLGPYRAWVSIFSVPEPSGTGERLYVGFVEDLWDSRSPSQLWSGPVAAGWRNLRPVPGHKSSTAAPNPKRYRVDRVTTLHGVGVKTDTMEIDLETNPAQLRREGTDQQRYLDAQPLGESLFMNDSLKLIVRLAAQHTVQRDGLMVKSYKVFQGDDHLPAKASGATYPWNVSMNTHILTVCDMSEPNRAAVYFLPMRPFGWEFEKLLEAPRQDDVEASFVTQMTAQYAYPNDNGELIFLASRHRVSVGLRGLSITTMERGLEYNSRNESWERPKTKR
ncbi:hypothetical protein [Humidesulfovibrio idahonensis]